MKWICIASYSFPYEAQIAKARLNSVGIEVYIENEHTINMNWVYSNALGGVRVMVEESNVEDANFLLAHDFSADLNEELNLDVVFCPYCQSEDIEPYTEGKRRAFFIFTVIGFPLSTNYTHGYKCKACEKFFK